MQKTTTLRWSKLFFGKMLPFIVLLFAFGTTINAQPYNNGNLSTGTTSSTGATAPAGYNWSEIQPGILNFGYNCSLAAGFSLADNFVVPAGVGWNISKITVYAYVTNAAATPSPFNDLRLQIFNTDPSVGNPTPIFGNLTTNRLTATNEAFLYRINNTNGTARKIWTLECNVNQTFGPGNYWIEWQTGNTANTSHFGPGKTVVGTVTQPGNNGKQHTIAGNTWATLAAAEGGNEQDLPFRLDYTVVAAPACTPITSATLSSVNQLLNEGFEQATPPPAGWFVQNNSVPGSTNWFAGNTAVFGPHSGAGYIAANFNNTSGTNTISNWLVTPQMTLRNGDQIKFWTRTVAAPAFPDRLQVRISQNGASTNVGTTATDVGDFSTLLLDINSAYSTSGYPNAWTQFTATVAGVPAGGINGRVALRYFVENGGPGGANSDYIGIDDLTYNGTGNPTVCSGGPGTVKVDIVGGISPYTVVLNAAPGGNQTINNYISGNNITVTPTGNPTTYTIVSVTGFDGCVSANNSGTAVFNTVSGSTAAVISQVQIPGPPTALISEDFVVAPPATWNTQNLSSPLGATNWFQGNTGVFSAPFGAATSYMAANFNNTGNIGTISNWAIPPSVLLKNGDVISFYTRTTSGAFPDRLQLRLNTTNTGTNVGATATSTGDFGQLLLDINPTYTATGYPTAWTRFAVTLSGLPAAGVNGRFAFRYFVENAGLTGANSDYIGIDSVRYTTFPLVNPTTCTGSTANIKVDITGGTGPYTLVLNANPPGGAGGNFTVTNYTSGTSIPVTPPVTTTYTIVSVTSANGCAGTGNSGSATITVSPTPIGPITIIDQPTGPLCAGDPKLLTVAGAPASPCFTNATPVLIPGAGTSGVANPYPSTISVAGLAAGSTITSVTLTNISHTWESDISVLLQSPANTNVILMSAVSGTENGGFGILNKTYTFSDAAPTGLNPAGPTNASGTYKPTNNSTTRNWPAPGPGVVVQPLNPLLSSFNAGALNGTWNLYVFDAAAGDVGQIAGGYNICFSQPSAPPVGYTWLWSPAQGLSSTTTNPTAASPMVTTTYQVMGTAPSGCQTTAQITITVLDRPAVTQQPANVTACGGTSVTFTGAGSGANVTYQWQVSTNGGGTWTNITNGAPYSGATTTTLTINPVTFAMNQYRYRLVVSGTCPPAANSNGAILTVIAQPTVTVSPNGTVCGGVAGIGGGQLTASGANTYTWAPATGLYTNATATTAYVAGANANPVYAAPSSYTTYTVTGTNTATGCSNTASVNVNATPPPPLVTPNPVAMCLGDPAVRLISSSSVPGTCSVASGPISVLIPDANASNTQNFLATSNLAVNCIPANATITGIRVNFSIPAHTYVADLSINLKSPSGTIINLFRNLGATAGTNTTYPNSGINNLTLSSASTTSLATANTPALGTLTGTYKADLINTVPTPGYPLGDPPGFVPNANSWTPMYANAAGAANGTWTLGMTDDGNGDVGTLTNWSITFDYFVGVQTTAATWSPNAGLFTDASASTAYTGTPRDTVWVKEPAAGTYTYNVTVQSLPPAPATVSTPLTGGNGNAIITFNVKNNNGIPYTLNAVATNAFSSGLEPLVRLWYRNTPVAGSPGAISVAGGWTVAASRANVNVTAGVANPVLAAGDFIPVGGLQIPAGATYGFALEFNDGITAIGYNNGTGTLLTTSNSGMDLITDGNAGWGGFPSPAVPANNPRNFNGTLSFVANLPTCTSPARVVTVTVSNPVVITQQPPTTRVICTNGSTSMTVAATGSGVTYQWQFSNDNGTTWNNISNNANYSGATTATLTITNPPVAWNGYWYRALVSGVAPCPSVPTGITILTVNPLPTITLSAAPYRNLLPGLTTAVFATSNPTAATYQWFRNGVAVPGGTTNPLTVNIDGLGTYTVRVTDVNGCVNTSGGIVIGDSTSGRVWIYPNPSTGVFGVRYNPVHNHVTPYGVNVRTAEGKLVWAQQYTLGVAFAPMNVDLSNYSSGTYWVEVVDIDGNRLAVGRVVVAR